ncbi:hypothetical protein CVIRNUC_009763 [Coccomyxa viridis]|uniref:Methyltransferase type 11 domain-containing protein n=1 Tax=Coccomyxa viridis TaxID=1274662 RepID=A0AAV1IJD4_9CHLO|nr:hypothetical protein CVIRNUC_009763 [Coccomyxa viridis]
MGDAAYKADPAPGPAPAFGTQSSYYNDAAALYADPKIRLHYPAELFERVYVFAGGPFSAALDVGTGTGQCAQQLALKYEQVWGVDANEEQLKQCKPHPNIQYHAGPAESTGVPSSSINLVTVATALHWYARVQRA